MPKKTANVLMLYASTAHVEDVLGVPMLMVDTSVTGWKVALDAKVAGKLRQHIDAAFPQERAADPPSIAERVLRNERLRPPVQPRSIAEIVLRKEQR